MTRIFGDFTEELPVSQEYLTLVFSPSSFRLKQRWRHNGLSADFLADYFATFFPDSEGTTNGIDRKAEVKGAVGYIANELLENAMKFHDDTVPHKISVALQLHNDKLVFLSTNTVKPEAVGKFQFFLEELTRTDPGELYIRKLESNASDETSIDSGLGFLTMMNDYLARIGWKFETVQKEPEIITVTTMVQLAV